MKEKIIKVKLKNSSYTVVVKNNLIKNCARYLKHLDLGKKVLIISQNKIPKQYQNLLAKTLKYLGYKVFTFNLPSGEKYKDIKSLQKIVNIAIKNKLERNDTFLALGGGVISDLTGFAASIYYRGINFICVPTSFLGMVDAAIGGKTGINMKEGKNLLGTFYQPKIVLIDPTLLKTLSQREFLTGIGEVIKYALLEQTAGKSFQSKSFYKYLTLNKNRILNQEPQSLLDIISHSVEIKAKIVSIDEKESGLRKILNLGHTFAHGIEQAYDYKTYNHGEAVSIGTCFAAKLGYNHGLITKETKDSIIKLVKDYRLPTNLNNKKKINQILTSMLLDKKIQNGNLRFILPYKKTGCVKLVTNISQSEVRKLLSSYN